MLNDKKGISLIILVLVIVVILVVGGVVLFNIMPKNTTVPDNNVGSTPDITLSEDKQQNTENEKVDEDLYDNWLTAFQKELYVSYKSGLRDYSLGTHAKGVGSNYNFILFAYETEKEYNGTLKEVFNHFNSSEYNLLSHIRSKGEARFMTDSGSLIKEQEQNVKINGINMIKFTGKAIDEDKEEFKIYGYTFIIDNVPGMLVGFDFSNQNTDKLIEDVEKEVDIMIKTLRTER